jgi:hypothetical protein
LFEQIRTAPMVNPNTPKPANALIQPSEKVAAAQKKVNTLDMKIKGMGGKAVKETVGILEKGIDILSRFSYGMENMRKLEVERSIASGGNITTAEHLKIFMTPFMAAPAIMLPELVKNKPTSDTMLNAYWKGFSGKEKTYATDVLKKEYPNWYKKHPVMGAVAGIGLDIASDPLTYVTMGEGTVVSMAKNSMHAQGSGARAVAKALLEPTVLSKAGRSQGRSALKDTIAQNMARAEGKQVKKLSKAETKLAKDTRRTAKRLGKGKDIKAGKPTLEQLKAAHGTVGGHLAQAIGDHTAKIAKAYEDDLIGVASAARYLARHPLKTYGSYSKGVRSGGIVGAGSKASEAAHAATIEEAINHFSTGEAADRNYIVWKGLLEVLPKDAKGNSFLRYGGPGVQKTFVVSDKFENFTKDMVETLYKYPRITQNTNKALRARGGIIAAFKRDQHSFITALSDTGGFQLDSQLRRNLLKNKSPFTNSAKKARQAKVAESLAKAGVVAKPADIAASEKKANEAADALKAAETRHSDNLASQGVAAADLRRTEADLRAAQAADSAAKRQLQTAQEAAKAPEGQAAAPTVDYTLDNMVEATMHVIAENKSKFSKELPSWLARRDPNSSQMDYLNGLGEQAVAVREMLKSKFEEIATDWNLKIDEETGNVLKLPEPKKDEVNHNRPVNRQIAEALLEAHTQVIRELAMQSIVHDPEVIAKSIIETTDEILSMASNDTLVQVRQFLHFKHSLSLPAMALPLRDVAKLFNEVDSTSRLPIIYNGFNADPKFVAQHFKSYLNHTVKVVFKDFEAVKARYAELFKNSDKFVAITDPDTADIYFKNYLEDISGDLFLDAKNLSQYITVSQMEDLEEVLPALGKLADELNRMNHAHQTGAVDKYTMFDHFAYADSQEELHIPDIKGAISDISMKDRKQKDVSIGRASFASKDLNNHLDASLNTDGIPAMSPEVLENLSKLTGIERRILSSVKDKDLNAQFVAAFDEIRLRLTAPDLRAASSAPGIIDMDPAKLMSTLGIHLHLLSDTSKFGDFGIKWRGIMAEKLWRDPSLMADLSQAAHLGMLHQLMVKFKTPEQVSDWLASKINEYPVLSELFNQASRQGVNNGNVGPVLTNMPRNQANVATIAAKKAEEAAKAAERLKAAEAEQAASKQFATDINAATALSAADVVQKTTEAESTAKHLDMLRAVGPVPSNMPGGYHAPTGLSPETQNAIQNIINSMYDDVDTLSLDRLLQQSRESMVSDIAMYDAKVRQGVEDFKVKTNYYLRIGGMPTAPLPTVNNPLHTYAGVTAYKQQRGRTVTWLHDKVIVDINDPKSSWASSTLWKIRKTSSKLDVRLNDIRTSISNTALGYLTEIHSAIRETYKQFRNKDELKSVTRDYFDKSRMSDTLDERFVEVDRRLNGIWQKIYKDTVLFTGQTEVEYHDPYVKNTIAMLFRSMPPKYRIDSATLDKFNPGVQPFSRKWFIKLKEFLDVQGSQHLSSHALSRKGINTLDMANFEYVIQHAATKIEMRSQTFRTMLEQWGAPMRESVTSSINKHLSEDQKLVKLVDHIGREHVASTFNEYYAPYELAVEMKKMATYLDDQMNYDNYELNFGIISKVNNYWKGIVTTWNIPSYHVGNAMSDTYVNLIDGVKPLHYQKAAVVMAQAHPVSMKIRNTPEVYSRINEAADMPVGDLAEIDRFSKFISHPDAAKHVTTIYIDRKPIHLSAQDIWKYYSDYGLGQNQTVGNLLKTGAAMDRPGLKQFNIANDALMDLSTGREDYFRLPHFIHALERASKMPNATLDDVLMQARNDVVKFHFDYSDVGEFERRTIAKWSPFYKWQRNILPLAFTQLFTNPKAYTIANALNHGMGEAMFPTMEDDNGNAIPIDTVIPRWVSEQAMQPIGTWTDAEGNPQARYAVLNLPLDQAIYKWIAPLVDPLSDQTMTLKERFMAAGAGEMGSIMSTFHPLPQAALQAGVGRKPVTGGFINNDDYLSTIVGMLIPGYSKYFQTTAEMKSGDQLQDPKHMLDVVGITRGNAVQESGKLGELRMQEDKRQSVLDKIVPQWMAANHPGVDPKSEDGKKLIKDYFVSTGVLQK